MEIEQEITFQLDADAAAVAMEMLLGRVELWMDGVLLKPLRAPKRTARLYLYVSHSELASDRWVLSLTGGRTKRVRKQRVSPTTKTESTERASGDALDAGGDLAAAFVKLKLARPFADANGATVKVACDWLIPVSPRWRLCGERSFWHLELEGSSTATADRQVTLGSRRLGPGDLITRSKAELAVHRIGVSGPYRLPPGAWRSVRDSVAAQVWSHGWVPAGLAPLLEDAGLAARGGAD